MDPLWNPFALPPLGAALLNFALIIWIYLQAPAGPLRRAFIAWTAALGLWNLGLGIGYLIETEEAAYRWYKLYTPIGVRFITPLFLHFVLVLTGEGEKRLHRTILAIAYGVSVGFAVLDISTPYFVVGARQFFWGYYPVPGKADMAYGPYFLSITFYAFRVLWTSLHKATGNKRRQLSYVFGGSLITFASGLTNFLPIFGIAIYPVGNLFNSLYSFIVAYAIIEYRLMNVQILMRRSTVYGMMAGGLTAVYLSLVMVLEKIFGHYGIQKDMAFHTAAFPVTVLLAPMMKERIEPFVSGLFGAEMDADDSRVRRQEMELIGRLATEMAHELSKPLTHIMNEGTRLESGKNTNVKDSLKSIRGEVQKASEILDSFTMLSPERPLHRMAVSVADLFDEALDVVGIRRDHGVRVQRRLDYTESIHVNPGQMVQILTNLIQNAWHAMPSGGELVLGCRKVGNEIHIAVGDTGVGIAEENRGKVFQPFFTTKKAMGGRGIGLTICRAMTERHGGRIQFESPVSEGKGTCMKVILPGDTQKESYEN
jgi:signal transduction histidine kinase